MKIKLDTSNKKSPRDHINAQAIHKFNRSLKNSFVVKIGLFVVYISLLVTSLLLV